MEAARGFGGLFLAMAAWASSDATSSGQGEAALKLGMGSARCGHPVFMAGSSLGRKARMMHINGGVGGGDDGRDRPGLAWGGRG